MIPRIRFSDFTEEWRQVQLKDTALIYDGTHQTPTYVENGVPFYSVEQVTANDFNKTKYVSESVYEAEKKRVVMKKGDILMTRIGDIGTAKYIDWNVRASFYVSLALIKPRGGYSGEFITNYISTEQFQRELWRRTIHVAFPKKINLGEIGYCKLQVPGLDEQQKINEFLRLINQKIMRVKDEVNSLQKYKESTVRSIFDQKIFFGTSPSHWQERYLKDVLTPGSKSPVINIDSYKKITVKLRKKGLEFTNQSRSMADTRPFYIRKKGEIIIGKQNYFSGSIAIISDEFDNTICSNAIMSFETKGVLAPFVYEYISRTEYLKKRESLANGTGQKELTEKDFLSFSIKLPNPEEQQKIVDFIKSIDHKIELLHKMTLALNRWKSQIMRDMFI